MTGTMVVDESLPVVVSQMFPDIAEAVKKGWRICSLRRRGCNGRERCNGPGTAVRACA